MPFTPPRRDSRPRRALRRCLPVVLGLVVAGFLVLVPGTARACACGAAYPVEGESLAAGEEVAFLSRTDDDRERLEMSLSLTGDGNQVAVLIPTPTVPEVDQGDIERLGELERVATPPEPEDDDHEGDGAGAPQAAPEVVSRTVLDDVVATVIRGGTVDGVTRWLNRNGYAQKPEVEPVIGDYLDEDWVFTAVKLRTDEPPNGLLDPIVLTFESSDLIYPMRMSSAADEVAPVTVYALADRFMSRSDADVAGQDSSLEGAALLEESDVFDDVLDGLVEHGANHLTAWRYEFADPGDITTDFTYTADDGIEATSGSGAEEPWRTEEDDDAAYLLVGLAIGVGTTIVVGGVVLLLVRARRRRAAGA